MDTLHLHKPTIDEELQQLIYEIMDGRPVFYQGFVEVLQGIKQAEEIMGSSSFQALLVSIILKHLYTHLDDSTFQVFTNEVGLHLSKGDNLSCDIVIYDKETLKSHSFDDQYHKTPLKIVIEIDTKADVSSFINPLWTTISKKPKSSSTLG